MLIQFALTLSILIGFCGLGIDVGLLAWKKIKLQTAADAAAIGAMYSLESGASPSAWLAAAQADAALNGFTDGQNGVVVTAAQPTAGSYAGNGLAVQVTVSQPASPLFFSGPTTMSAQATALGTSYMACSYFLSQTSTQPSLELNLAKLYSGQNACNIYLGRSYSLNVSTSSGPQFFVAGGSAASVSSLSTLTPPPRFNVASVGDPLSSLPAPLVSGCDRTGLYTVPNGVTLRSGTYCGGIRALLNNKVIFGPGTYIIAGPLDIEESTITGSNVTFYMTQLPGYPAGTATLSLSNFTLSAPTSGPLEGILFFSDRSLPTYGQSGQRELDFEQSNGTMDGILYLPGQELYANLSTIQTSHYLGAVADWFDDESFQITFSADYSVLSDGNPMQQQGAGGLVD